MKNQGVPADQFDGKPVIGVCNTWSELTPCNAHFRDLAESVRRGVLQAGGFPLEFPVMSLGETLIKPTAVIKPSAASAALLMHSGKAIVFENIEDYHASIALALVKNGDVISLDAGKRTLQLEVSDKELEVRRKAWKQQEQMQSRGCVHLHQTHVEQSHLGADMDFLKGGSGSSVSRDSH